MYLSAMSLDRESFSITKVSKYLQYTYCTSSWKVIKFFIRDSTQFPPILIFGLLKVTEITLYWNIMYPWLELGVEKLNPIIANMKHQWVTQKEMFEAKTSCHPSKIDKISAEGKYYSYTISKPYWCWYHTCTCSDLLMVFLELLQPQVCPVECITNIVHKDMYVAYSIWFPCLILSVCSIHQIWTMTREQN